MPKAILITGTSSEFGEMVAYQLANEGHIVYAAMRGVTTHNAETADAAVAQIMEEQGRIDVLIHNAGHMGFGSSKAFTPEQLVKEHDVNVVGTQRLNRAALPQTRRGA